MVNFDSCRYLLYIHNMELISNILKFKTLVSQYITYCEALNEDVFYKILKVISTFMQFS